MSDSATPWTIACQTPDVYGISQARILELVAVYTEDILSRQMGDGTKKRGGKADFYRLKSERE